MDQMTRSIKGVPWGGFSAVFMTAILFMALPFLSHIQYERPVASNSNPVFIKKFKPPPPLPDENEQWRQQEIIEKTPAKEIERLRREKPKFDVQKVGPFANNQMNLLEIPVVSNKKIEAKKRDFAYDLNQVDKPPRYLRKYPPQYPYIASRDHIEGKVSLRFVVDIDGLAKEVEVVKVEPEGYFEEAALEALERYKFKPAIKNGEAVMCNAALTLTFVLD